MAELIKHRGRYRAELHALGPTRVTREDADSLSAKVLGERPETAEEFGSAEDYATHMLEVIKECGELELLVYDGGRCVAYGCYAGTEHDPHIRGVVMVQVFSVALTQEAGRVLYRTLLEIVGEVPEVKYLAYAQYRPNGIVQKYRRL